MRTSVCCCLHGVVRGCREELALLAKPPLGRLGLLQPEAGATKIFASGPAQRVPRLGITQSLAFAPVYLGRLVAECYIHIYDRVCSSTAQPVMQNVSQGWVEPHTQRDKHTHGVLHA